ncbi:MAG: fibronectin type III domain-containing protein, partial [Actinomycetota bacterium]|nr:fibronectin type III domain-containing protein [Actinomycetota bacterium]
MSPFTAPCTFVSAAIDAGTNRAWLTLNPAATTPTNTSIQFATRTSDNGATWSAFSPLNGTTITSPNGRYLQYRATLDSTDTTRTPQLTSVQVSATGAPTTVPGAPTIGTATRGNGSGSVTFTPPANNGGSAITSYTATCASTNSGATGSNTGPGSPIVVSGLTNGKTYTCTVTAQNAQGSSAPSAESNSFVPATVPGAPTIGTATRGNGSASVTFTAPANNGGSAITGYTATCTSTNSGVLGSNTGPASPITVTGLTNGKTYTCTVTAANAVGTSTPSAA